LFLDYVDEDDEKMISIVYMGFVRKNKKKKEDIYRINT
jgi:hypothetical protein